MSTARQRVIAVEGRSGALAPVCARLDHAGYRCTRAAADVALRRLDGNEADLFLVDGSDAAAGWEGLVSEVHRRRAEGVFVPVIVFTPPGDVEARIHCLRLGADECIPFDSAEEETLARIEALLRIKSIQDRMERSRRELQRLSTVDGLTGLSSRRHLQARCREELMRARRYRDPLSLILVDVDHFREVTGRLGEAAGDAVLCEVARRLRGVLREVDLAGRQGGDTFVVVLPSTHITGALAVAERIWKAIGERPFLVAGERLTVRVSLGLSFFPARGVSSHEDLFRLAQDALHRAKREGRGRICLFQAAHYFYQPLSPGGASGGGS